MNRSSENSFEYLRDKLRNQMNDISDHVSGGACKDYNDYAKCCGIIEGLALAERELLDLKSKIEAE
jgi:hypothetical protein|tara:strand:- start:654 stop:851 length:198 start_codon:yes stop_codon:yes gene_type:complete